MSAPETALADVVLCRTCMRPITFETRTEPGFLPREGWYDDARVDALVCFKAHGYRHVPLTDRERAYYGAGVKAGSEDAATVRDQVADLQEQVRVHLMQRHAAEEQVLAVEAVLAEWRSRASGWPRYRHADDISAALTSPGTALAKVRAEAWREGAESTAEWMANNPGPSGIPHDPPTNPYEREAGERRG